jgi:hypothetical protein
LNRKKCRFNLDQIPFFGHLFTKHGIKLGKDKADAVKQARRPKNGEEVRSFLGLVNFSGRFIENLATISAPLRNLTKKNIPFMWDQEHEQAFLLLKEKISCTEVLAYFDLTKKTQITVDASPVGLGAVLTQQHTGGNRVIAYASRSLSEVEKRYSQTEKESLAIVWGCEHFSRYLLGVDFDLITDHRPLERIYSPTSRPSARIER